MMENKTRKKFDSVKLMREIRENLSNEYKNSLTKEKSDLEIIKKKYNINNKIKMAS